MIASVVVNISDEELQFFSLALELRRVTE